MVVCKFVIKPIVPSVYSFTVYIYISHDHVLLPKMVPLENQTGAGEQRKVVIQTVAMNG